MKLTKSDIEKLKPLESYFIQVKEKYKRASTLSEDTLVSEYYTKLTGKLENNFSCNQCVFKIYSTVGQAYWEALKTYAIVLVLCFLTSVTKDLLWGVRDRLVKLVSKL